MNGFKDGQRVRVNSCMRRAHGEEVELGGVPGTVVRLLTRDEVDAIELGLSRLCNPYPGAPYHLYGGDRAGPLPLHGKFAGKFDTLPEAIAALLEWRSSYPYDHVIGIYGDGADDSGDGLSDDERERIEEAT